MNTLQVLILGALLWTFISVLLGIVIGSVISLNEARYPDRRGK